MNKTIKFLPLLATGLLAVGCQDYDAGFTAADFKNKEYAENFAKAFGTPDPNQDWTMATLVSANVNLPQISGTTTMNIMTGDPRLASTRLLAKMTLNNGKGQMKFDAIKGMDKAYVTIEKEGKNLVSAEFNIVNGMLNLGDVSEMIAAMGMTRAAQPGEVNNVTKGEVVNTGLMATTGTKKYFWKGVYYTDAELRAWAKEQVEAGTMHTTNYAPFNSDVVKPAGYDYSEPIVNTEKCTLIDKVGYVYNNEVYTEAELLAWVKQNEEPNCSQHYVYSNVYDNISWDYENECMDYSSATPKPSLKYIDEANKYYKFINNNSLEGFFTLAELIQWTKDRENNWICNGGALTNVYFEAHLDIDNATINTGEGGAPFQFEVVNVPVTYLNGVEKTAAPTWTVAEGSEIFGKQHFFMEKEFYFGPYNNGSTFDKTSLYGETDEEKRATIQKLEAGFSIQTTGGEIDVPFVYGSTDNVNQFGYVYYKTPATEEAQQAALLDIFNKPHYILMEDGRPQSNIFWDTWKTGTPVKQMELSGIWNENSATNETKLCGTNYKLSFFGEDYQNTNGSYYFPAGYTVVFFICPVSSISRNPTYTCSNMNYSLPELNKQTQHLDIWSQNPWTYDATRGVPKSAAWITSKGDVFMGFEDGGGDEDLNDIVFWVKGNFTPTENLVEVEVVNHDIKWHKNFGKSHDETDSDLHGDVETIAHGSIYTAPETNPTRSGYTFLGWSEDPESTVLVDFTDPKTALEDKCYYAVWEENQEGPTSITVKWHTNITTPGEHKTNDSDLFVNPETVATGGTYSQPSDVPTRDGYTFKGWSTDPQADPTGTFPAINDAVAGDEDICYFAIWAPEENDTPVEPNSWIFACEDLGGSFDYDFNDVVWEVIHVAGTTDLKVKLLAAGGTLPFELKYGSNSITTKAGAGLKDEEIYEGPLSKEYNLPTVEATWTVLDHKNDFKVLVGNETSGVVEVYTKDDTTAPQVIVLPAEWEWPVEGTRIDLAYNNFKTWVVDGKPQTWANWQAAKVAGKTVTH